MAEKRPGRPRDVDELHLTHSPTSRLESKLTAHGNVKMLDKDFILWRSLIALR